MILKGLLGSLPHLYTVCFCLAKWQAKYPVREVNKLYLQMEFCILQCTVKELMDHGRDLTELAPSKQWRKINTGDTEQGNELGVGSLLWVYAALGIRKEVRNLGRESEKDSKNNLKSIKLTLLWGYLRSMVHFMCSRELTWCYSLESYLEKGSQSFLLHSKTSWRKKSMAGSKS